MVGRKKGTVNYDGPTLLSVIRKVLPIAGNGWKQVGLEYQARTKEQTVRSSKSMKKYFNTLVDGYTRPTGKANGLRAEAQEISHQIDEQVHALGHGFRGEDDDSGDSDEVDDNSDDEDGEGDGEDDEEDGGEESHGCRHFDDEEVFDENKADNDKYGYNSLLNDPPPDRRSSAGSRQRPKRTADTSWVPSMPLIAASSSSSSSSRPAGPPSRPIRPSTTSFSTTSSSGSQRRRREKDDEEEENNEDEPRTKNSRPTPPHPRRNAAQAISTLATTLAQTGSGSSTAEIVGAIMASSQQTIQAMLQMSANQQNIQMQQNMQFMAAMLSARSGNNTKDHAKIFSCNLELT